MIVDFHTHTFPETIAKDAVKTLESCSGMPAYGIATETALLEELKSGPVTHAVSLPVATKPEQVPTINNYNRSRHIDNLFFLGAMHPGYPDFETELRLLKESGVNGIKLHPEFQAFYPDDTKLYPLYETVIELDMFILFHAGDEEFMKHVPAHASPSRFAHLHDNLPDLKMVLAHFGSHKLHDEVLSLICGKAIYIDCSYSLSHLDHEKAMAIIDAHKPEFLLYGSDWPWQPLQEYYRLFESLRLHKPIMELICRDNALGLLGKNKHQDQ
jgi:hypothetical protein